MERLTIKYEGLFTPKKACTIDRFGEADDCDSCDTICDSTHGSDCANCVIQECFTRLGEYENTGLTPEEIRELKERDTAMEINEIHVDEYYCPACGAENNCDQGVVEDYFCPRCRQRLKEREN